MKRILLPVLCLLHAVATAAAPVRVVAQVIDARQPLVEAHRARAGIGCRAGVVAAGTGQPDDAARIAIGFEIKIIFLFLFYIS